MAAAIGAGTGAAVAKFTEPDPVEPIDDKHVADIDVTPRPEVVNHVTHVERIVEVHHHTTDDSGTRDGLKVISYNRYVDPETGEEMDVAKMKYNGTNVLLIDGDLDGYADAMVVDINGDENIQAEEVFDISNERVVMQPFYMEALIPPRLIYVDNTFAPDDLLADASTPKEMTRDDDNAPIDYTDDNAEHSDGGIDENDNEIEILAVNESGTYAGDIVDTEDISVEIDNPGENFAEPQSTPAFDPEPMADPMADNSDFDDMQYDDDMLG